MIGASNEAATVTSPETLWPGPPKSRTFVPRSGRSLVSTLWPTPVIVAAKARFSINRAAVSLSCPESRTAPVR